MKGSCVVRGMLLGAVVLLYGDVNLLAVTVGSDSAVSVEAYQAFPSGADNSVLSFGWMKSGLGLQDATTTCSFASAFPLSGHLSLHGGTLTLDTDLVLQNQTTFASAGHINGQNHMFSLCESVTAIPASHSTILEDVALYLNHDLNITHTVTIKGVCSIYGGDNNIVVTGDGNIVIDPDSSLLLSSIELHGLKHTNLRCADHSGKLVLSHVRMVQTNDYSFINGSILFKDDNIFVGPYIFHYGSSLTSTIDSDSSFQTSNLAKLRLGRQNGREPLYLVDQTSVLYIENATFNVINDGITLTRGTVLGNREVIVDIESTSTLNGLSMGNGNAADDGYMRMLPSSVFVHNSGHMVYDIVEEDSFFTEPTNIAFKRAANTVFYIKQNIDFNNVNSIVAGLPVYTLADPSVSLFFQDSNFTYPLFSYAMTGTRNGVGLVDILDNNNFIELHSGVYQFGLQVNGKNNDFRGVGSIAGPITLVSNASSLTLFFDGPILQDVTMNGGTIFAEKRIDLGGNVAFQGEGKVNLQSQGLVFGTKELNYTGSISWTGEDAFVRLNSSLNLSSEWTFTGHCNLDLNWHEFNVKPTGKVVVGSNSTLHISNGYLANLDTAHLYCVDSSSKIIFDNVYATLDSDFTFSIGSIEVRNIASFSGSYTVNFSSVNTSTITSHATFKIGDGTTFVTGRSKVLDGREPLYFEDSSSVLAFDDSTFVITSSGMRLTRGQAVVNKRLKVDITSTSTLDGVIFGNLTEEGDFITRINPGATWELPDGHIGYENVSSLGIQSVTTLANVKTSPSTVLHLLTNVLLKDLTVIFTNGISAQFDAIVDLLYDNCTFQAPGIQFRMTSKRYNAVTNLLENNHSVYIETGDLPLLTLVTGSGNVIQGFGGIAQLITLASPSSELSIGIDGIMLNRISLNNSTLNITKRLIFGDNDGFSGAGIVNLNSNTLEFGGLNLLETSTIDFVSDNGTIELRSNLHLASRWTVSGDCTINGNGNSIVFATDAQLVIHPDSKVVFKNIKLDVLKDGSLFCLADSGSIVFDSAILSLDGTVTFSQGSFKVSNKCDIEGTSANFVYESTQTSTIGSRSYIKMKADSTFTYSPSTALRKLLYFEDASSGLKLMNANFHSTSTGAQLLKGTIEVHGLCKFISEAQFKEEGIILGDGDSSSNDLNLDIYPESVIKLVSGYLVHRNVTL